jgi:hypothetical protein
MLYEFIDYSDNCNTLYGNYLSKFDNDYVISGKYFFENIKAVDLSSFSCWIQSGNEWFFCSQFSGLKYLNGEIFEGNFPITVINSGISTPPNSSVTVRDLRLFSSGKSYQWVEENYNKYLGKMPHISLYTLDGSEDLSKNRVSISQVSGNLYFDNNISVTSYTYWGYPNPVHNGWSHYAYNSGFTYINGSQFSGEMPLTISDSAILVPPGVLFSAIKVFSEPITEAFIVKDYLKNRDFF